MTLTAIHLCAGTDAAKTVLALHEAGIRTITVNTSTEYRLDRFDFAPNPVPVAANVYERFRSPAMSAGRFAFCWLGALGGLALRATGARAALERACDSAGRIDFIFAHWGSGIMPEVALLKGLRALADVPVILNMETFPTAARDSARQRFESLVLRRTAPLVDGLILGTKEMAELVEREAPALLAKPTLVAPFYFPRSFTATSEPPVIPARPGDDVIFTGWADLVYSINDVRAQMLELARAGLCVHTSPTPGLEHANVKIFERFKPRAFTSGELASFMRRFRASLVTFNTDASDSSSPRFRTSLPTRLLFTLAAGVPVLIPRGRLPASERLVAEHGVGLVYSSPEEARDRLLAPSWADVQRHAYASRERFAFDVPAFLGLVAKATRA